MSSTNKTTHFELSQYIGTDKPTYLGDYNSDMLAIDTAIYTASENASTAVSTANSAASAASDAATAASAATTTANNAADKADLAKTTAETASTNASAALTAAQGAETAAAANTITNLAPAYDPTLTYAVDDLVTHIDGQGSGKLYKCIVAIDNPEAFNINKWDDVTVSDVLEPTDHIVITSDGVKTFTDVFTAIRDYLFTLPLEILFKATVYWEIGDGNAHNIYRVSEKTNNMIFISNIANTFESIQLSTTHIIFRSISMDSSGNLTGTYNEDPTSIVAAGRNYTVHY